MRLRLGLAAVASLSLSVLFIVPVTSVPATGCDAPLGDPFATGMGHDHRNPLQHALGTTNYELVGHLNPPASFGDVALAAPLVDEEGIVMGDQHDLAAVRAAQAAGGMTFGEVAINGRYAAIAAISSPIGVYVVDIADPANPTIVGRWTGPSGGYVTDVKWSTGGNAFYASVQAGGKNGLFLIDATVKSAPKEVEFWSIPNGVHMIGVRPFLPIPGVDVVYGATGYSNGVFTAFALADLPKQGFVKLPTITGLTAHDVWLTTDPITQKELMYVANSYRGIAVVDVTNPQQPSVLGTWNQMSNLYFHTIRANVVDGKRTLFVSPEYFYGSSGQPATLYTFDATDFGNIRLVGSWRAPGNHPAQNLVFSTHNFQLVNGTIYLAHYHGGVWTIDARDPANLRTLGYYLPHDHTFHHSNVPWPVESFVPADWDVVVHEGYQYVGDITGGLYVLRYACDAVGPGGPSSSG